MDTPSFESDVDVERLLASPAHVVWVKNLAARLIRDESDRDDAVQDSLLATWVRRASLRFPRAFAAVYLRSAGAHAARGRSRRGARERAAIDADPPSDPAHLVEQADLYGMLIRKLAALDEPYRSALIQRYVDDLEPHEIARRAGVPAATIRSRLQRGLEKLRAELDAAHGGDRETWVRAFILLLPARVGATALVATPLAAGLVLFAAFLLAEEPVATPLELETRVATHDARDDAGVAGSGAAAAPDTATAQDVQRTELAPNMPGAQPPTVVSREHHVVVCDIGGRPIGGARVTLVASQSARDIELVNADALPTTFADGAGRATVTLDADMLDAADRELVVVAMGYGTGRFPIDPTNAEQRLSLYDKSAERAMFDLVDEDGNPLAGVIIVGVGPTGDDVVTDAHGRFEAPVPRDVPNPKFTVRIEGAVSEWVDVGAPAVGLVPRRCVLGPSLAVRCMVADASSGAPIVQAEIIERARFQGPARSRVLGVTDGEGKTMVRAAMQRSAIPILTMLVVRANGYPPVIVDAPTAGTTAMTIRLTRGTSIAGVAFDAGTRAPLAGARLLLQFAGLPRAPPSTQSEAADPLPESLVPERGVVLRADDAGRFQRADLPSGGTYAVSMIGDDAYEASRRAGVLTSGVTHVEIAAIRREETARGRLVGTLSFNGTRGPIPFRWTCADGSGNGHANADGSYAIERVAPGPFALTVFVPGICERVEKAQVTAGETTTLDIAMTTPLARVRGRAVRADGSVVPFLVLSFQGPEAAALRSQVQACTDAQGLFEAWLPVEPKAPIEIVPQRQGAKAPVKAIAGDENILVVLPRA